MGRKKKVRVTILPVEEPEFKEVEKKSKLMLCNDIDECFIEYKDSVDLYLMNIEKRVTIESHDVFNELLRLRDNVKLWRLNTVEAIENLYSEIKGGSK